MKMQVKKIEDSKEKGFVIWNAKDDYNDNYYLFAKHHDLLYNLMVFDPKMTVKKQLDFLKILYELNKD